MIRHPPRLPLTDTLCPYTTLFRPHASEQERADVTAARAAWFDGQSELDPDRLIFIDESGLSTKMARLRGWAPKGERCRAAVPHGHWKDRKSTRLNSSH